VRELVGRSESRGAGANDDYVRYDNP